MDGHVRRNRRGDVRGRRFYRRGRNLDDLRRCDCRRGCDRRSARGRGDGCGRRGCGRRGGRRRSGGRRGGHRGRWRDRGGSRCRRGDGGGRRSAGCRGGGRRGGHRCRSRRGNNGSGIDDRRQALGCRRLGEWGRRIGEALAVLATHDRRLARDEGGQVGERLLREAPPPTVGLSRLRPQLHGRLGWWAGHQIDRLGRWRRPVRLLWCGVRTAVRHRRCRSGRRGDHPTAEPIEGLPGRDAPGPRGVVPDPPQRFDQGVLRFGYSQERQVSRHGQSSPRSRLRLAPDRDKHSEW